MKTDFLSGRFTHIADIADQFSNFSPYVASVNNDGVIAFQASLRGGGSGVFRWHKEVLTSVVNNQHPLLEAICSHPDINGQRQVCFYAISPRGETGVYLVEDGDCLPIAQADDYFAMIGPLGPTMNEIGQVAFRADLKPRASGIFRGDTEAVQLIASTSDQFTAFHGLPVITEGGQVIFRADLQGGGRGIFTGDGATLTALVETGDTFSELGLFPTCNTAGMVLFNATLATGEAGIFTLTPATMDLTQVVEAGPQFASFRGGLLGVDGPLVFYGIPHGGKLGIYKVNGYANDPLLAIGNPLLGSTIAEFALNPVSGNEYQFVARVRLVDGKQLILNSL